MKLSEETKKKIQIGKDLFVVLSDCTKLPFVECDETTFDDEILVFTEKDYADTKCSALLESGNPVRLLNVPPQHRLGFFSGLYTMGVNAVLMDQGTKDEERIEVEVIVKRPEVPRFSEETKLQMQLKNAGKELRFRIENPEFHLTAIYLTQLLKSRRAKECKEEINQLKEEMIAHYHKGYFIAVRSEKDEIPLLKREDGDSMQPIFTDAQEMMKFQKTNPNLKLKTSIVTEQEILKALNPDVSGVVVNPMGIGLVMKSQKK